MQEKHPVLVTLLQEFPMILSTFSLLFSAQPRIAHRCALNHIFVNLSPKTLLSVMQLATKTFHDTMFSIRHTSDPMWKATRKTLAQAFTSEAIR